MSCSEESTAPAEIPDDDPGWPRYEQIADEWREEQDPYLREWLRRSSAYLWESCGRVTPWSDAGPESKISSGEEEPPGFPAAETETAA